MADAEDVVQTVFLRLGSGEGVPLKNAGSYLYRAAINGALDLLRRRKIALVEPIDAAEGIASTSRSASPDTVFSAQSLPACFARPSASYRRGPRRCSRCATSRRMGNREIAALMGTSQAVVAVTLHQTRSKLKKPDTRWNGGSDEKP